MIQAGFYECDITPPYNSDVPGGFNKRRAVRICDPLKVRAAVFSDGEENVALVGIDSLGTGPLFLRRLKEAFPSIRIIFSASHTHYGGMLKDEIPGIESASEIFRKVLREDKPAYDHIYYEFCLRQCITAVQFAYESREEVDLSFGRGKVEGLIFNRRIRMKNGKVMTHPGKGNSDSAGYAGPVDDELGVLGVWKKDSDELLGFLLNFSCHACINLEGVTADFPGVALETVKSVFGKETKGVYLNGASGDVTQIDNMSLVQDRGRAMIYKLGRAIGGEAIKILATAPRGEVTTMKYVEESYLIPRNPPEDPAIVAEAREIMEKGEKGPEFDRAWGIVAADMRRKGTPELWAELAVFQLGPLAIGSTPCEVFAQMALDFKAGSRFPFTWLSQLSFIQSYIPTSDAFDPERGGGYEALFAQFDPRTSDEIRDILSGLLKNLTPEEAPRPEMVPASNQVWDVNFRTKKR